MRNIFLTTRTARDIDAQVAKVLRDLGQPEPPLQLDLVRELLRLDRQYYSSANDGALREVAHRLMVAGKQVLARPTLLFDAIRKLDLKALLIPDRKRILLDASLPDAKQRWSEAHEIGHSLIVWHGDTMLGDSKYTLTLACHERVENEANYAAGQLLFLQDSFVRDARDLVPSISGVLNLKKRYENTITTTLWRFVEQSDQPLIGGISHHPLRPSEGFDAANPFRYFVGSRRFIQEFSKTTEVDLFGHVRGYCANKGGGPLGSAEVVLKDDLGKRHLFGFETFFNRYEALTLGVHRRELPLLVVPGSGLVTSLHR